MHELSVALSLIDVVEEEAARHPGRVEAVHLRLGPLSGVIADALVPAFEMARTGTPLEGVRLLVEEVPIIIFCPHCQERRTVDSMQWFCCPVCDTPASQVVQGRELEVVALEMSDA